MGADAHSRVFYNRVKGAMELSVARMGYPAWSSHGLRSSTATARHWTSPVVRAKAWVCDWRASHLIPSNYRAIKASDIAGALISRAGQVRPAWSP